MTNEEKQLLFKVLCEMLPYGAKVSITAHNLDYEEDFGKTIIADLMGIHTAKDDEGTTHTCFITCYDEYKTQGNDIETIKPYLRPMSSMTEEEKIELKSITKGAIQTIGLEDVVVTTDKGFDYLIAHHFDYRGLIPMGLALEAPDGMYNKEESEKGSEIPIPKTVDEAVKTLDKIVSKEDRDYLLENGAISMYNSLGRWIRNEWGLWTDSELKNELKKKGFEHPDDMSNYIIEEFIKYLNNKI